MPRISPAVKTIAVALALTGAGAGSAQAASTTAEQQVRANLAANPGSVRVAPNRIQLAKGVTMTLPAQGQIEGCSKRDFCLYEDVNFREARLDLTACTRVNLRRFRFIDKFHRSDTWDNEASSWVNNQVGGAVATLYSKRNGKGTWFRSSGRKSNRMSRFNDNVESIKPC
jgi:hypothetical protein